MFECEAEAVITMYVICTLRRSASVLTVHILPLVIIIDGDAVDTGYS